MALLAAATFWVGRATLVTAARRVDPVGPGGARLFLRFAPPASGLLLWFAPLPTMRDVVRRGSTGGLPPLPYFSMLASGLLWAAYGAVLADWTIIVPNAACGAAGACYSAVFYRYDSQRFATRRYSASVLLCFAFVAFVVTSPSFSHEAKQDTLGWLGSALVVAMFAGPLQVMRRVVRHRSTRDLPLPMCLATVVNTCLWTAYGVTQRDAFVWAPNLLGLGSGIAQLCLFARYGVDSAINTGAGVEGKASTELPPPLV